MKSKVELNTREFPTAVNTMDAQSDFLVCISDLHPVSDVQCSSLHIASAGSQAQTSVLLCEAHTQQLGHLLWVQEQLIVELLTLPERGKNSDQHSFCEINSYPAC